MRLFIAVEINGAVTAAAERIIDTLRRRAQTLAPTARVTWLTAERMHLTVRFIGNVDNAQASTLQTALEPAFATPSFDLVLQGTGAFPLRGAPRVIWAGLREGRDQLVALEREVTGRLTPLGIPPEARPYSPHLTLARVREAAGVRASALLESMTDHQFGVTRVDAITLFESRLSPKGPAYVPLLRTALRGA